MERCLICLEDLPIEKLCADVEGSRGVLLDGCKHFYCVECVKKLPKKHRKCSLCNLKMVRLISHQCQKCQWGLIVEGGGMGDFRLCHLEEGFGLEETKQIIEGENSNPRINKECMDDVLSKVPCYTKSSRRLDKNVANWLSPSGEIKWYPLFEGQENPETDPFICSSELTFVDTNCYLNMIVVAKWKDSEEDLFYGFKTIKLDETYHILPRKIDRGRAMVGRRRGFPDESMLSACKKFIRRMGWADGVDHNDDDISSSEDSEESFSE